MSACCARICSRPSRSTWALLSGGERGSSSNTRPLGQSARRPQQRSLACHATSDELGKDENVKLFYASLANLEHDQVGHPEKGARVPAIMGTLEKYGLRGDAMSSDRRQELVELHNLRPATVEEVAAVHVPAYPKELPTICMEKGPGVLEGGGPTYFTAGTSEAAFRSAGAGMQLVDLAVATSRHRSGVPGAAGFGVCRPPGPLLRSANPQPQSPCCGIELAPPSSCCLLCASRAASPPRTPRHPSGAYGFLCLQQHLHHGEICTGGTWAEEGDDIRLRRPPREWNA
mmetsp:Transcript_5819/g.16338  ORF Transcript_5819/g.16338 Transcript_5819/m.16338 type:complete len:287 (-) Transcript_5819:621-1481(-)